MLLPKTQKEEAAANALALDGLRGRGYKITSGLHRRKILPGTLPDLCVTAEKDGRKFLISLCLGRVLGIDRYEC